MLQAQRLRFEPEILVDYTSPEGAHVSGVRGMLLQGRLKQLRESGYWDDYLPRLSPAHRTTLLEALASAWVPVEAVAAHFAALDEMGLSEAQLIRFAEPLAATLFESLFAGVLRAVRQAGVDAGIWMGLRQGDRVWNRMYHGGGCKVIQVGPKDAIVEISGLPYARSRCFRVMHCGFLRGVIAMTAKTSVVKATPSRDARPDRLAVSISWV